jgi:hypothetical protein
MSVKIDTRELFQGLTRIADALPQVSAQSRRTAAQSGVDAARNRVHIITGRLRNSLRIISETQEMTRFGSDVWYAGFEEFRPGHSYIMAEYNRLKTGFPEIFLANLRRVF